MIGNKKYRDPSSSAKYPDDVIEIEGLQAGTVIEFEGRYKLLVVFADTREFNKTYVVMGDQGRGNYIDIWGFLNDVEILIP